MTKKQADLESAYALKSPQDNRRLYAGWAESYDQDFATRMGFRMPALIAARFEGVGPVLDVGAGTGLLGQALAARGIGPIDGIDISTEMLAVARGKSVYRDLIEADLTQPLTLPCIAYHGIVSSGTFTHGHVGPQAIEALLGVAAPGAQFVLSIFAGIYVSAGFEAMLGALAGRITLPQIVEERIYDAAPDAAHRDDTCLIVTFRTL
jgi:SAM-dependent methyltransferase